MLEEFDDIGRYGAYFMLGMSNVIFLLYDLNLDNIYHIYIKRFAPKFRKKITHSYLVTVRFHRPRKAEYCLRNSSAII